MLYFLVLVLFPFLVIVSCLFTHVVQDLYLHRDNYIYTISPVSVTLYWMIG